MNALSIVLLTIMISIAAARESSWWTGSPIPTAECTEAPVTSSTNTKGRRVINGEMQALNSRAFLQMQQQQQLQQQTIGVGSTIVLEPIVEQDIITSGSENRRMNGAGSGWNTNMQGQNYKSNWNSNVQDSNWNNRNQNTNWNARNHNANYNSYNRNGQWNANQYSNAVQNSNWDSSYNGNSNSYVNSDNHNNANSYRGNYNGNGNSNWNGNSYNTGNWNAISNTDNSYNNNGNWNGNNNGNGDYNRNYNGNGNYNGNSNYNANGNYNGNGNYYDYNGEAANSGTTTGTTTTSADTSLCAESASTDSILLLTCPTGTLISAVPAAAFGVNSGTCPAVKPNGAICTLDVSATVLRLCLNSNTCQVTLTPTVLGQPQTTGSTCATTGNILVASFVCSVPGTYATTSPFNATYPSSAPVSTQGSSVTTIIVMISTLAILAAAL